jgi:hypothetical protein
MTKRLEILIPALQFSASAFLLEEEAPETCAAILQALPIEGRFIHSTFSGMVLEMNLRDEGLYAIPPENAIAEARPRDLAFWYSYWERPGQIRGMDQFAEINLNYGTNRPCTFWGPKPLNLFAIIDQSSPDLIAMGKAIRRTGGKNVIIRAG